MRIRAWAAWTVSVWWGVAALAGCSRDESTEQKGASIGAMALAIGGEGGQGPSNGLGEVKVVEQGLSPGDESTGANLGTAMCGADQSVVGGGCDCNGQSMIGTRMEDKGWSCACVGGAGQRALAVCAEEQTSVASVAVAVPERRNQDATAQCPAGRHVIAVGVHCGFTGANGPNGPTGNHGHARTVTARDSTHVAGQCSNARVGGVIDATLYGYCVADTAANIHSVKAVGQNTSTCEDGTTVVGGGCQCHDPDRGPLQAAYVTENGFECSCKNGPSNETVALCADL